MVHQSKRMAAVREDQDDIQEDHDTDAHGPDNSDIEEGVKLTEISDIVAKYAVVDTVFEDDKDDVPAEYAEQDDEDEDDIVEVEDTEDSHEDIFAQHEEDHPAEPGPLPAGAHRSRFCRNGRKSCSGVLG